LKVEIDPCCAIDRGFKERLYDMPRVDCCFGV
jgi:hypothetical protein